MSDDPTHIPLPDDVQALLNAGSGFDEVPTDAHARIWQRLDQTLDLGGLDAFAPDHPAGADSPTTPPVDEIDALSTIATSTSSASASAAGHAMTLSISKVAAAVWTASTFALGTLTGVGTHAILTQPEPNAPIMAPIESRDMGQFINQDMTILPDFVVQPDLNHQEPDMPPDMTSSSPITPPKPASTRASLEAERLLLARAQRALAKGDGAEALDMIRQHERRFGASSALSEERDFLRIRTLLASGRRHDARPHIKAFTQRYPQSIFLDALHSTP